MDIEQLFSTGIYAITGEKFSLGRNNIEVVQDLLSAGVKIIQYREKYKHIREKYQECLALRKLTKQAGACFIINDNIDLAMLVQADGVHVGQDDLPIPAVRSLVGPDTIIGLSTRNAKQAQEAVKLGINYIGVGPIYTTKTKDDVKPAVGFEYLDYVVANIDLPFVAIGGIKLDNIKDVFAHGAKCAAMITELVGVEDIKKRVQQIKDAIS